MEKEMVNKYWKMFRKLSRLCVVKEQVKTKASLIGRMECRLLQVLKDKNEPQCMNDLSDSLSVSHSRITRIVDNLVKKKFVERFPSNQDRRKWLTRLTPAGLKASDNNCEINIDLHKKLLKKLPEQKHQQILNDIELYLNSFIEILQEEVKNEKNYDC